MHNGFMNTYLVQWFCKQARNHKVQGSSLARHSFSLARTFSYMHVRFFIQRVLSDKT